ncbi:MAG: hypothetical protein WBL50_05035 [Candidatus Acidiferrum sp.]
MELHADPATIRLIKIDVEGNEELTVQGMRRYLSGPAPAPLWREVRGPSSGRGRNSVHSVSNFLAQFGYKPFHHEDGQLLPFRLGLDPEPQVFDLLFAVPGLHGNVLPLQTL